MTKKDKEKIVKIAEKFFKMLKIKSDINAREEEGIFYLDVETGDNPLVIGRGGENLPCFEHIIKLLVFKEFKERESPRIVLDIAGYRKSRLKAVQNMAKRFAEKVLKSRRPEVLKPMNAYERRLVHIVLKNYDQLITESVGEEPARRIIIKIKK